MSDCPIICRPFAIFLFVLISSVGVQHCDSFIPTLVFGGPQWITVKLISLYVHQPLCLGVCILYWKSLAQPVIVSSAISRRPWGQIPWVAVQHIHISVRPSVNPVVCRPFAIFVFILISSVGVQLWDSFIFTLGSKRPLGVQMISYVCLVSFSVRLRCFLNIIHAACNCAQHTQPQGNR